MKEFCQFLAQGRSGDLRCVAGLNFASVGSDRARCRVCALQDLGDAPICPTAEVYTFLKRDATGAFVVGFEMDCALPANAPAKARCDTCPERASTLEFAVKARA
jgi:hypothetical protein